MAITYSLVPEELGLHDPILIGAFMGWPDASLGASGAVRFLVESLNAVPLATWDGDEYYDFAELRPVSRVMPPRDRILVWPQGEFWVARAVAVSAPPGAAGDTPTGGPPEGLPEGSVAAGEAAEGAPPDAPAPGTERQRSLVMFLAHEPRLRWRTYGRELAGFARRCGIQQAVFFGAAYADVPHTRAPIVTGWATDVQLRTRLEARGVPFSGYQGPSSMQSAAIEACRDAGMACASLFSNGPSYLTIPNANLSLALLRRFVGLFRLAVDLEPLQGAAATLTRQVSAAIEERSDAEFREHLRRLEARFDAQAAPLAPGEVRREQEDEADAEEAGEGVGNLNVDPQDVVRELEDFLRRRSRDQRVEGGEGTGGEGTGGEGEGPPPGPDEADGPASPR